jgi:SAM-dependent methyltransferase
MNLQTALKTVIPESLRPIARHSYRSSLEAYYAIRLLFLRSTYRRCYGRNIITTIHPRDEMYRHHRQYSGPLHAKYNYLATGHAIVVDLEAVLRGLGRSLENSRSLLEFACGYGRVTRFLVMCVPEHAITVSDIDHSAVDFNTSQFRTRGFYSVTNPDDLVHVDKYDIIFVVSLFSHLPFDNWGAWLKKLYTMLHEHGLIIFSTHGMSMLNEVPIEVKRRLEAPAPGFCFLRVNETEGRLATDDYGTAYVDNDYVARVVAANKLGRIRIARPGLEPVMDSRTNGAGTPFARSGRGAVFPCPEPHQRMVHNRL